MPKTCSPKAKGTPKPTVLKDDDKREVTIDIVDKEKHYPLSKCTREDAYVRIKMGKHGLSLGKSCGRILIDADFLTEITGAPRNTTVTYKVEKEFIRFQWKGVSFSHTAHRHNNLSGNQ